MEPGGLSRGDAGVLRAGAGWRVSIGTLRGLSPDFGPKGSWVGMTLNWRGGSLGAKGSENWWMDDVAGERTFLSFVLAVAAGASA